MGSCLLGRSLEYRDYLYGVSFPLNVKKEETPEVLETPCPFCLNTVKYTIDFSLSVFSPTNIKPRIAWETSAGMPSARATPK
jgi:hypothetical protein